MFKVFLLYSSHESLIESLVFYDVVCAKREEEKKNSLFFKEKMCLYDVTLKKQVDTPTRTHKMFSFFFTPVIYFSTYKY